MRKENLRYIKQVKEAVAFLNKTFPGKDYPKFIGMLAPDNSNDIKHWQIVTDDYFLYMGKDTDSEELNLCKEAIRAKFKKFKIVFLYQYYITSRLRIKDGYLVIK